VVPYGQIAALVGLGRATRRVGYALLALDAGDAVPWQPIDAASGRVKPCAKPGADRLQRLLLEPEGVRFGESVHVSLRDYRVQPRRRQTRRDPGKGLWWLPFRATAPTLPVARHRRA